MKFYSQNVEAYKTIPLGTCKNGITLYNSSCYVSSFCNWLLVNGLDSYTPEQMNQIMIKNGLYDNGCNFNSTKVAAYFGLDFELVKTNPGKLCIIETNHYAKRGIPQHFTLFDGKLRVDPLDATPAWEKNDYNLVSFRVFKKKAGTVTPNPEAPMDLTKFLKKLAEYLNLSDLGSGINEGEAEKILKEVKDLKDEVVELEKDKKELKEDREELRTQLGDLSVKAGTLDTENGILKQRILDLEAEAAKEDKIDIDQTIEKFEEENFTPEEKESKLTLRQLIQKLFKITL